MTRKEIEHFALSYEFEDRAQFFAEDVIELAKRFRSIEVKVGNLTKEGILLQTKRIKKLEPKGKSELLNKVYEREHNYQAESAEKNEIVVRIFAQTSRPLTNFELKVDALAKALRGIRMEDEEKVVDRGPDSEEDYRFEVDLVYDFKNDFKS